jgi:hypothetical protein
MASINSTSILQRVGNAGCFKTSSANTSLAAAALVVLLGSVSALSGCQQYVTSPAIPTARGMSENPNAPAPEQAITAALQYVATRWAPGKTREFDAKLTPGATYVDQAMVINLPAGTRQSFYDRIARKLGPTVQPATPENTDGSLPIYHVGRVWLRFENARVDVYRPMLELGPGPDGKPVYQMVTVHLRGGFSPWRAEFARAWDPGVYETPEVFYRPTIERANEHEIAMRGNTSTIDAPSTSEAKTASGEAAKSEDAMLEVLDAPAQPEPTQTP